MDRREEKSREYSYDMGGGLTLTAHPIDPNIRSEDMRELIADKDGKAKLDLNALSKQISCTGYAPSFAELRIGVSQQPYQIPEQLRAYRNALGIQLDNSDPPMFNGHSTIVDGEVHIPLILCPGRYYDFKATELHHIPADLLTWIHKGYAGQLFVEDRFKLAKDKDGRLNEKKFLERYPNELIDRFRAGTLEAFLRTKDFDDKVITGFIEKRIGQLREEHYEEFARAFDVEEAVIRELQEAQYPAEKTIEDLMQEHGIPNERRGRLFGLAHLMFPANRNEFAFVQKIEGLGIAGGCMTLQGSTPLYNPNFFNPGFDFQTYYMDHLAREMMDEFGLKEDEFSVDGIWLMDDKIVSPFGAVRITTPLSTKELAERTFGQSEPLEEHNVLYYIRNTPGAFTSVITRFPMFCTNPFVMDFIAREGKSK